MQPGSVRKDTAAPLLVIVVFAVLGFLAWQFVGGIRASSKDSERKQAKDTPLDTLRKSADELKRLVLPAQAKEDDDTNRLRTIVGLLSALRKVPLAKDGKLDVYAPARKGDVPNKFVPSLYRSERNGMGPTKSDIEAGNFQQFAYGRYTGNLPLGASVPVLWDLTAGQDGKYLVAFGDTSCRKLDGPELRAALERLGQDVPADLGAPLVEED